MCLKTFIHYAGKGNLFAVPISINSSLLERSRSHSHNLCIDGKGLATGTVLAFMMAVTALSLPEMIILRKVLKIPLRAYSLE
jgi:uncharacterized membrane protein YraQ (UPF0718 family)